MLIRFRQVDREEERESVFQMCKMGKDYEIVEKAQEWV